MAFSTICKYPVPASAQGGGRGPARRSGNKASAPAISRAQRSAPSPRRSGTPATQSDGGNGGGKLGGGQLGGGDGDSDGGSFSFARFIPPLFVLADANVTVQTPNPRINLTRVVAAILCLAIPALAVLTYQDGKVDKYVILTTILMLLLPAVTVLRRFELIGHLGAVPNSIVANSFFAAEALAVLRVFFGLSF